jgi:hypothetical protein
VFTQDRAFVEDDLSNVESIVDAVQVIRSHRGDDVDSSVAHRSPVRVQRVEVNATTQVVDLLKGHSQTNISTEDPEARHPLFVVEYLRAIADKAINCHILGSGNVPE